MKTLGRAARRPADSGAFLPPLQNILPSPVEDPDRVDYFRERVALAGDNECWEWQGSMMASGYGRMYLGKRGNKPVAGKWSTLAHRMAYSLWRGPIPDGLVIDHLCRTRSCCNPSHMEPVTQAENARRANATITECPSGHDYTPENTYYDAGSRKCRTCVLDRQRAAYAKKVGK